MDKRESFKNCAGFVLAKLDDAHPDRVNLMPSKLLAEMGEEGSEENRRRCFLTVEWLEENGYIRCDDHRFLDAPDARRNARLTDKGFAALEMKIDFRGKSKRIGDALAEQVETAVGEARKAAIGELVGHVFGGFTKSWFGS